LQKEEKIRLLKIKLQEREAARAAGNDGTTAPSASEGMSEPIGLGAGGVRSHLILGRTHQGSTSGTQLETTGLILPDPITANSDSAIGPISGYTRSSQSDFEFSESYL
jgi:hypothetical protein